MRNTHLLYRLFINSNPVSRWMEACLNEELPATTELEEAFRNGVFLAKLGNFFSPETVPLRKIFDKEFKVLNVSTISGRNIMFYFRNVFLNLSVVVLLKSKSLHARKLN